MMLYHIYIYIYIYRQLPNLKARRAWLVVRVARLPAVVPAGPCHHWDVMLFSNIIHIIKIQ